MPTKLRFAVEIEGIKRAGKSARKLLEDMVPSRTLINRPSAVNFQSKQAQIQWLFDRIDSRYQNKKLWMFREPARTKVKDSKYKQLIRAWGLHDPFDMPQWALPELPRRRPVNPRGANPRVLSQPQNRPQTSVAPVATNWITPALRQVIQRQRAAASTGIDFFGEVIQ